MLGVVALCPANDCVLCVSVPRLMRDFAEISHVPADVMCNHTEQQGVNSYGFQHLCRTPIPGMMVLPIMCDFMVQMPLQQPVVAAFAQRVTFFTSCAFVPAQSKSEGLLRSCSRESDANPSQEASHLNSPLGEVWRPVNSRSLPSLMPWSQALQWKMRSW